MMKAGSYNRRILSAENQPNLSHFQDISKLETQFLAGPLKSFVEQFSHADTYGSLMTAEAPEGIDEAISDFGTDFYVTHENVEQMMQICTILSQKYDAVVTNPPYMGGSGMDKVLSEFVKHPLV